MILIISNEFDQSTHEVLEWLAQTNENIVVLNEFNSIKQIKLVITSSNNEECCFHTTSGETFKISDIEFLWYRRGPIFIEKGLNAINQDQIDRSFRADWSIFTDFIFAMLSERHYLGNPTISEVNKFNVLLHATRCGLKIPSTLLTNQKECIIEQFGHAEVVSKPFNGRQLHSKTNILFEYTTKINLRNCADSFNLSFIQELVQKKYELRIFFLKGIFYSSAIFSQNNDKTKIDFRKYDFAKPNRVVPFILPTKIENQLKLLMEVLHLDTGSIDMLVTTNNEYVFLEVNPVGQFGMVSKPCNYYLENKISKILMQKAI